MYHSWLCYQLVQKRPFVYFEHIFFLQLFYNVWSSSLSLLKWDKSRFHYFFCNKFEICSVVFRKTKQQNTCTVYITANIIYSSLCCWHHLSLQWFQMNHHKVWVHLGILLWAYWLLYFYFSSVILSISDTQWVCWVVEAAGFYVHRVVPFNFLLEPNGY